jgi:hypothetical protein
MKKVQILFITMIVASSVALFSFKSSTNATKYGGSGSVKIDIYKTFLGKKTEKSNTVTLNATVSCFERDAVAAKQAIQRELETKASQKIKALEETWEYAGEIDFRINSCD